MAAPPLVDWAKVEIKATDLGNKTWMLTGQGGNITIAVGSDAIIMVDGQFAPLSDKIKAAIKAISPLPIRYLVNTHFHGDHTGGNENFAKDGATIVAHDNIRVRLAAGTVSGMTGVKAPPRSGRVRCRSRPMSVGSFALEAGGRKAQLTHIANAHTDGDSWVYFADANVLCDRRHLQQSQALPEHRLPERRRRARHDPRARHLHQGVERHRPRSCPATARSPPRRTSMVFRDMLVTSHDRIKKLYDEGKSEEEVIAAKPLADLDATWANNPGHAAGHTKNVYNSFKRL